MSEGVSKQYNNEKIVLFKQVQVGSIFYIKAFDMVSKNMKTIFEHILWKIIKILKNLAKTA